MAVDHAEIERLAEAWRQGDRACFDELVLRLHRELYLHVAACCDSRDLVEEALQETFITCFHKIETFQQRGSFLAWMRSIARNHLVSLWRKRQHSASLHEDLPNQAVAEAVLAELDDQDEERARKRSDRLSRCLEQLPQRSRRMIESRYLEQRPLRELAQHFQTPVATLSVTLHRIRQALRRCIEAAS
jgi:RNA polymerase sigma-70 factor (ECF subfamily)